MSESLAESWRSGAAKALERQYAALVAAEPVKSPAAASIDSFSVPQSF
jgi:hypothetical protein